MLSKRLRSKKSISGDRWTFQRAEEFRVSVGGRGSRAATSCCRHVNRPHLPWCSYQRNAGSPCTLNVRLIAAQLQMELVSGASAIILTALLPSTLLTYLYITAFHDSVTSPSTLPSLQLLLLLPCHGSQHSVFAISPGPYTVYITSASESHSYVGPTCSPFV